MTAALLLCCSLAALAAPEEPPNQSLLFYNARLALKERRAEEALKLWLLRNTVESSLGEPGLHDRDFRSVVWAAAGQLGLCPDGFQKDGDGAGLWPLAFHNWVVRNMSVAPPPRPPPFDAFEVGRQQRFVSLHDVLAPPELRTVSFFRTDCLLDNAMFSDAGQPYLSDMKDRRRVARLLRYLLELSRQTLSDDKVLGRAAIEARIFDINLTMAELAAREAKRQARAVGRKARERQVAGAHEISDQLAEHLLAEAEEEGEVLKKSLSWTPAEWMTLTPDRRLFLFAHARRLRGEAGAIEALELGIIDELIARREGAELEQWIAHLGDAPEKRALVWSGERGARILAMDAQSGFRERAVIALHRGVSYLEAGDLPEALRSLAYALDHAEQSRQAEALLGLGRRWLSYVVGRYAIDEDLLATLAAIVPRQDFYAILEDLLWRAALAADAKSFALSERHSKSKGALDLRTQRLRPLAEGNVGRFATQLRDGLATEPYATLRFVRQILERLEAEDGDIRAAHAPTLRLLIEMLEPMTPARGGKGSSQGRTAEELVRRSEAVLDGLGRIEAASGPERNARALSAASEVFAGSVRLAPSDALPWPFAVKEVQAPSVFTPLALVPVEWRDPRGELVFGWRVRE